MFEKHKQRKRAESLSRLKQAFKKEFGKMPRKYVVTYTKNNKAIVKAGGYRFMEEYGYLKHLDKFDELKHAVREDYKLQPLFRPSPLERIVMADMASLKRSKAKEILREFERVFGFTPDYEVSEDGWGNFYLLIDDIKFYIHREYGRVHLKASGAFYAYNVTRPADIRGLLNVQPAAT